MRFNKPLWPKSGLRLCAWLKTHWRKWIVLAVLALFFSLLGFFTSPAPSSPGACLIYGQLECANRSFF